MTDNEILQVNLQEAQRVVRCVYRWMEIAEENGRNTRQVDAVHSALLLRLILGKEPLPKPPPRFFSYPCYDFADKGYYLPSSVYEQRLAKTLGIAGEVVGDKDLGYLIIDQSCFKITVTEPDLHSPLGCKFQVTWPETGEQYILEWVPRSHEWSTCEGTPGVWRTEKRDGWVMKELR